MQTIEQRLELVELSLRHWRLAGVIMAMALVGAYVLAAAPAGVQDVVRANRIEVTASDGTPAIEMTGGGGAGQITMHAGRSVAAWFKMSPHDGSRPTVSISADSDGPGQAIVLDNESGISKGVGRASLSIDDAGNGVFTAVDAQSRTAKLPSR